MYGANLVLFVLLGQGPADDPAALVGRLGSPRYAEREAAADALERLGRQAIPALRAARDARDPEVRTRAAALSNKIEGALLTQPTMVRLDFDDQPLPAVVKRLADDTGIKLSLVPENVPTWANRRVTIRESAPVPFWRAMDRLCESARLQSNFGMQGFPGSREPVFQFFDGGPRIHGPTSDSGPFRISLLGLHYQWEVGFGNVAPFPRRGGIAPPPPVPARGPDAAPRVEAPAVQEQFYAQVQVAAEPRLSLSQNGPLKLTEAVDDRGQSLLPEPDAGPVTQRVSGYFGLVNGALQLHAPLKRPEQPGQSIRSLRGTLPVVVATRKPDPLIVPLPSATGKTFQNDDVSLSVLDIRVNPVTHQTNIDVVVRANAAGFNPASNNAPEPPIHRPDFQQQQQQIEIVDAQGGGIAWYQSNFVAEESRMTLILNANNQAVPTELRYYGLARAATEVSFEFHDVPMPMR
jgi:hypothetical protein